MKVTNTEDFVGISKGDNETSAQGQGVITTKDDSEKANYTFLAVGKASEEGKPVFLGSAEWSTLVVGCPFLTILYRSLRSKITIIRVI